METNQEAIQLLNELNADWAEFICPKCGTTVATPNGKNSKLLCPDCHCKQKMVFSKILTDDEI